MTTHQQSDSYSWAEFIRLAVTDYLKRLEAQPTPEQENNNATTPINA